jgi:hypothetical protein
MSQHRAWDIDHLKLWERTSGEDRVIDEFTTDFAGAPPEHRTIQKLRRLSKDVVDFVSSGSQPSVSFADLPTSIALQMLLNQIERTASVVGPSTYVLQHPRQIFDDTTNLERLG